MPGEGVSRGAEQAGVIEPMMSRGRGGEDGSGGLPVGVPGFDFRPVSPKDWPDIARLLGQDEKNGFRLERHMEATYDPFFGFVAVSADSSVCGAAVAGIARGTATSRPTRALQVVWIGVTPAFRRRGIARELFARVHGECVVVGATSIEVTVDGGEAEAISFFRAQQFEIERQTMDMVLSPDRGQQVTATHAPGSVEIRALHATEVGVLTGLLIHLAVERAVDPHDDLEALTPTAVTSILRRPGTVAYGAWEHDDPTSPVGFAIAVRRADEGVLRFIGVHEDSRRLGVGRALLGAIVSALGEAVGTAPSLPGPLRPVAIRIHDPEPVQVFFRKVGAEIVRVRMDLVRGA